MSNKLIRFSPTGIEYGDYAWNPMSGCRHKEQGKCPPVSCWAETIAGRFKDHYPDGFKPHIYPEAFLSPLGLPRAKSRGKRVLVNFMSDMFGDWVDPFKRYTWTNDGGFHCEASLREIIYSVIERRPDLTFVFLTKNPAGMRQWGKFPDNCELGFSAWDIKSFIANMRGMFWNEIEAKVKWCSLEPLLDWSVKFQSDIWKLFDWVAVGALTGTKKEMTDLAPRYPKLTPFQIKGAYWGLMPPVDWLKNIVEQCDGSAGSPQDAAGIYPERSRGTKVFMKNNLRRWIYTMVNEKCGFYNPVQPYYIRQECGGRVSPSPLSSPLKGGEITREAAGEDGSFNDVQDKEFYKEPEVQV